jgi:hypothetical protein
MDAVFWLLIAVSFYVSSNLAMDIFEVTVPQHKTNRQRAET